jgi:hypothetical protein
MSINRLLNLSKERDCYMFQKGVNFHCHSRNGYSLHTPTRKPNGQLRMGNPETGVKQNQYNRYKNTFE